MKHVSTVAVMQTHYLRYKITMYGIKIHQWIKAQEMTAKASNYQNVYVYQLLTYFVFTLEHLVL